ncbi:hypothetical protein FOZ63_018563, partial [Perkinsus olseni]
GEDLIGGSHGNPSISSSSEVEHGWSDEEAEAFEKFEVALEKRKTEEDRQVATLLIASSPSFVLNMHSAALICVITLGMVLLSDLRGLAHAASAQPNTQRKETCTLGTGEQRIEFAIEDADRGRVSTVYIKCRGTRLTGDGSGILSNGRNDELTGLRLGPLVNCDEATDRLNEAFQPRRGRYGQTFDSDFSHLKMCNFLAPPEARR